MANELGIYQLFRNILTASRVIEGRFFVLATTGQDMNSTNMGEIIVDELGGMKTVKKYPCCVMLAPKEVEQVNNRGWSTYTFIMFFLKPYRRSGDGTVQMANLETNISEHTKEMDWKDMREVAGNFRKKLREITRVPPMPSTFREHVPSADRYTRVNLKGNDMLNGVQLIFEMQLYDDLCDIIPDYDDTAAIEIPDFSPHPLHKL